MRNAEDRPAVRRQRSQAGPMAEARRPAGRSGQHLVQGLFEHPPAGRVQARVPAGELDGAGHPEPVAQRGQRRLAAVIDDRKARRPVPAGWRTVSE